MFRYPWHKTADTLLTVLCVAGVAASVGAAIAVGVTVGGNFGAGMAILTAVCGALVTALVVFLLRWNLHMLENLNMCREELHAIREKLVGSNAANEAPAADGGKAADNVAKTE